MKDFGTESLPVVVLSWFLAAVVVLGLLPWRVVAQAAPDDDLKAAEAAEEAEEAAADRFQPVRAAAGKYTVAVDHVRPAHGESTMRPSGFPMIPQETSHNVRSGQSKGGSWSGGGATMGGGHGGSYLKPNLILDVKVEPAKQRKGKWLLAAVNGKVHARDEHGNELDSPPTPAMWQHRFTEMDYPEGSGRTAIHLHRPRDAGNYIRSLEGELLVIEAKRRQFVFKGKELSRKTTKRDGNVTVVLDKVTRTPEGIDVAVAASPAPLKDPRDPFERMQRMITSRNRVNVTLEDTQGRTYQPTQIDSDSGGSRSWKKGNASGGTSWGSSSGSGGASWGPGGSGRKSWSSGGGSGSPTPATSHSFGGGRTQHEKHQSRPTQKLHFDLLPKGAKLKAVRCTVTDHLGKPEAVAFRLEGIPLPGAAGR